MLIEFTVGNYLSFDEPQTLSLEAARITESPDSIIDHDGRKVLKSAVLYGANSSGKSNLLNAIGKMRTMVGSSASRSSADSLFIEPFMLRRGQADKPSHFQIVLMRGGLIYRYGFEATDEKISQEWLYLVAGGED